MQVVNTLGKSLVVEAVVFWLLVNAIIIVGSSLGGDIIFLSSAVITALFYLIVAYMCWNLKRWSFAASIILGLFTITGTIVFTLFENISPITGGPIIGGFEVLFGQGFIIVPHLIQIFYSLRSYFELKTN